jgi:hypothetical protein
MGLFGLWIIATVVWHAAHGTLPSAYTMGAVGFAALAANAASFGLLWAYRRGDANMRSAWICTRNDVLGNLAVLLAALGVFGTGTGWPDIIVAAIMATLALQGATLVVRQSLRELRQPIAVPSRVGAQPEAEPATRIVGQTCVGPFGTASRTGRASARPRARCRTFGDFAKKFHFGTKPWINQGCIRGKFTAGLSRKHLKGLDS